MTRPTRLALGGVSLSLAVAAFVVAVGALLTDDPVGFVWAAAAFVAAVAGGIALDVFRSREIYQRRH